MEVLMRLLLISWRNIFRNKRRSILTLAILVFGSTGLILIGGFFDDNVEGLREQFIHSQTGHIQVNVDGYYKKGVSAPFEYLMKGVAQVQREIETIPHVLYTVPRLKFAGMSSSDDKSIAVMALGVDAVNEQRMGSLVYRDAKVPSIHIVEGKALDPSDLYGAVLGKGLLKILGLKVGDSFSFITTREAGTLDGATYHVRGSFETLFKDFDDQVMKVNLESAQKLLNVPDHVHSLLVVLDETGYTEEVNRQLKAKFESKGWPLESITWEEQGFFYRRSRALLDKIYLTVQVIVGVVFFFSIANAIGMTVFERIREFGTMMALGNGRATIFALIFFEAVILGLFGTILGAMIGSGMAKVISAIGIEMPPPTQGTIPYLAMISLSPRLLIETFLVAMLSTMFSSVIPAWRASRFRIIAALGYV